MREKLIELIDDFYFQIESITKDDIEEIADHLLANGVILPPCKVGDTVYELVPSWSATPKIKERTVQKIEITGSSDLRITLKRENSDGSKKYYLIEQSKIGKTIFLTPGEAERALKGGADNA